jgi:drug/metabolite transporter (DMT)-like permease
MIGVGGLVFTGNTLDISIGKSLFWLVVSGFLGHAQQLVLVLAVRNESPATVNMIECLAVIWSILGDVFLLDRTLGVLDLLGTALVGLSCVMISKLNMRK